MTEHTYELAGIGFLARQFPELEEGLNAGTIYVHAGLTSGVRVVIPAALAENIPDVLVHQTECLDRNNFDTRHLLRNNDTPFPRGLRVKITPKTKYRQNDAPPTSEGMPYFCISWDVLIRMESLGLVPPLPKKTKDAVYYVAPQLVPEDGRYCDSLAGTEALTTERIRWDQFARTADRNRLVLPSSYIGLVLKQDPAGADTQARPVLLALPLEILENLQRLQNAFITERPASALEQFFRDVANPHNETRIGENEIIVVRKNNARSMVLLAAEPSPEIMVALTAYAAKIQNANRVFLDPAALNDLFQAVERIKNGVLDRPAPKGVSLEFNGKTAFVSSCTADDANGLPCAKREILSEDAPPKEIVSVWADAFHRAKMYFETTVIVDRSANRAFYVSPSMPTCL